MTIKSLLNWGGFGSFGKGQQTPVERWHGGYVGRGGHSSHWDHHSHGHGHWKKGGGKGGGGAAISALTLLAFLFLLNVMQQSLNDNNATVTTTATAILLRDQVTELTARDGGMKRKTKHSREHADDVDPRQSFEKGDTFGFDRDYS